MTFEPSNSPSSPPHSKLLSFDHAEIRASKFNGDLFLYVEGKSPKIGWDAVLEPRIYDKQPEYVTVEIVSMRNSAEPSNQKSDDGLYKLSIPINDLAGAKGIKLVGHDQSQIITLNI